MASKVAKELESASQTELKNIIKIAEIKIAAMEKEERLKRAKIKKARFIQEMNERQKNIERQKAKEKFERLERAKKKKIEFKDKIKKLLNDNQKEK